MNAGFDDYHQHGPEVVTSSTLRTWLKNPLLWEARHVLNSVPEPKSPAMDLGQAVHTLTLEPHMFDARFFIDPFRLGSPESLPLCQVNQGKIRLTPQAHLKAVTASQVALSHPRCPTSEQGCLIEQRSEYKSRRGLTLRCKPDALTPSAIYDLKTTSRPLSEFNVSFRKLMYDVQAAFYWWIIGKLGGQPRDFIFWIVQTCEPFHTKMSVFSAENCAKTWSRKCLPALKNISQCLFVEGFSPADFAR